MCSINVPLSGSKDSPNYAYPGAARLLCVMAAFLVGGMPCEQPEPAVLPAAQPKVLHL